MRYLIIFLLTSLVFTSKAETSELQAKILKIFPTAEITAFDIKYHYTEAYVIKIDQWLDHNDHSKGTFRQRLFLSHVDQKLPMVMVTEGYNAGPRHYELAELTKGNQLIVEYRYFGESTPDVKDYQFLTNQQAMEDLHRINKAFKKIYKKEWISTGISKGGTTCMYYKATYPKDVCVAVPYVAPLPVAREDIRCDEAILTVGDDDCRNKLFAFQRSALEKQDSLAILFRPGALSAEMTFNRVEGIEKAIEYSILEYPFSFYQMGYACDAIPENASANDIYKHLKFAVGLDFYSDKVIEEYEPSFYQFMTQNGYYGFMHAHLDDLIQHLTVFDNAIFAPRNVSLDYDPSYNIDINKRLDKKAKRIIIFQGEMDPWGALTYLPKSDKVKLMVQKGGSHRTRISSFPKEEQKIIFDTLDDWLKAPIYRPN